MRFDEAVDLNLGRSLKRIRIKVDPVYASYSNFRNINSYEGYVVTETEDTLQVMMIKPGMPVMSIAKEILMSDDAVEKFKEYLIKKLNLDDGNPLMGQILNCNHLNDIETFLKQSGNVDADIVRIYRDYIYDDRQA